MNCCLQVWRVYCAEVRGSFWRSPWDVWCNINSIPVMVPNHCDEALKCTRRVAALGYWSKNSDTAGQIDVFCMMAELWLTDQVTVFDQYISCESFLESCFWRKIKNSLWGLYISSFCLNRQHTRPIKPDFQGASPSSRLGHEWLFV